MEFFRHCPQCGRRFHIKLVNKKLERLDRESTRATRPVRIGSGGFMGGMHTRPPIPLLLEESQSGEPIIIDIEEFQYTYRCKHCGHEWSEKHVEEHKER
jgi:DNA-directed RNA polymerase subunit RPC12/RpoP